jgi:chemosensory pili system protein ChpA (sensor histidine kinase/response regulator)
LFTPAVNHNRLQGKAQRLRQGSNITTSLVLLLSNESEQVAVHVDSIVGNVEAVVKPLSPFMRRIPGLSSATLLNDGQLCLILDPVQLSVAKGLSATLNASGLSSSNKNDSLNLSGITAVNSVELALYRVEKQVSLRTDDVPLLSIADEVDAMASTITTQAIEKNQPKVRLAMVVDDSLTVRKVTQKLLIREGWEVVLAKDGIDALEQLQTIRPAIMLVDIEMPRMDGFDLTRNVRSDSLLSHIPIIMITSRIADKHREYALSLGVTVYMGKPYHDEALLAAMEHLLVETI